MFILVVVLSKIMPQTVNHKSNKKKNL